MVCRYENETIASNVAISNAIGVLYDSAANPPMTRTRRISSVAYATDDNASDDSTASPVTRDSRSWCARWVGIGRPRISRLIDEYAPPSGTTQLPIQPARLADGLGVGSPLRRRPQSLRYTDSPLATGMAAVVPPRAGRGRRLWLR